MIEGCYWLIMQAIMIRRAAYTALVARTNQANADRRQYEARNYTEAVRWSLESGRLPRQFRTDLRVVTAVDWQ